VPGLVLAEQFAGAAKIEVAGADREAGAQLVQRLHRPKPLQRRRRDLGAFLGQQHQIAAHATAPTRPRSWWSWARPKRSARQISIVLARGMSSPASMMLVASSTSPSPSAKPHHLVVDLGGPHLAMGLAEAEARHQGLQPLGHRRHVLDPGHTDEALAAAPSSRGARRA
jgi:hypothetical protein